MKILLSTILLSLSFSTFAIDKVVYGDDNRLDLFESKSELYKSLAESTAAMISTSQLEAQKNTESFKITGYTLEDDGVCSDARFAKQITAANCSGFLVGDQYLVTAGHCITSMDDCGRYSWVFNFSNKTEEKKEHIVSQSDVYTCTEIIARKLDRGSQDDFALVKLDRKVEGRTPLKFRTSGKVADKTNIVVIGHPSGLPSKISDGAIVRSNSNKVFFQANLDTFGGNSGSAVFDSKTGIVEGILVRGETDYVGDPVQNCTRPKVCTESGCRGEDVTRITNIKELMKL